MQDEPIWTPSVDNVDPAQFSLAQVGPYALGRVRRCSRFGSVHEALHPHFAHLVELELLHGLPQQTTRDVEGTFMLELAHALGLEHRHVATFLGAGLHEGTAYVVRPLVLGHTLHDLVSREHDEAAELSIEVLHAATVAADFLQDAGPFPSACGLGGFEAADVLLGYDGSIRMSGYGLSRFRESAGNLTQADLRAIVDLADRLAPEIVQELASAEDLQVMQTILRQHGRTRLAQRGPRVGRCLRRVFAEELTEASERFGLGAMH